MSIAQFREQRTRKRSAAHRPGNPAGGGVRLRGPWALVQYRLPHSSRRARAETLEACPGGTATCAAIGPKSGQLIATGGHDGVVRVWRVGRDAALGELTGLRGAVAAAAFDPGEHLLMAGAETGGVTLFDLPGMRAVRKMRGHSAAARTVAFHPGNPAVLVSGGADGAVRLWDARSGSEYVSYKGHSGTVTCCVFSPDGRWLAVGDSDGTLRVWDLGAGKALATLVPSRGPRGGRGRGRVGGGAAAASAGASTRAARSAWFHPTDLLLLSSGDDRAVRCWDVDTGRSPGGAELPMLHPVTGAAVPPEARPIRWGRFVPGPAPVSATLPAGASAMLTCSRDAVRGWAVGGRVETEEGGAAVEATPLGAERVAWGDLTGAWLGRGAALGDDPPPAAVVAVTPSRHGAVRVFAGTPSPQLWEERQGGGGTPGGSPFGAQRRGGRRGRARGGSRGEASPPAVVRSPIGTDHGDGDDVDDRDDRGGGGGSPYDHPRVPARGPDPGGAPSRRRPPGGDDGPGRASPRFRVETAGDGIRRRAEHLAGGVDAARRARGSRRGAAEVSRAGVVPSAPAGLPRDAQRPAVASRRPRVPRTPAGPGPGGRHPLRAGPFIAAQRHAPLGIDLRAFLPGRPGLGLRTGAAGDGARGRAGVASGAGVTPMDVEAAATSGAAAAVRALQSRLVVARVAAALWRAGDPTKAVLHAIGSRDADVAASACERADLEAAGLTMKQVSQLLAAALREAGGSDPASRPASAVSAASDGPAWPRRCVASLALQACHMFAGFVHATLGPARAGGADGGVSMAEEERRDRCERLLASLRSCRSALAEPGARGREAEAATRSQALLAIDRVLLPLAL